MSFILEIRNSDFPLTETEQNSLHQLIFKEAKEVDPASEISIRTPGLGEFRSIDPSVLELLIALSGSSVLAVIVEKAIDFMIARNKEKKENKETIHLTINNVSVAVSTDAPTEEISKVILALQQAADHENNN